MDPEENVTAELNLNEQTLQFAAQSECELFNRKSTLC